MAGFPGGRPLCSDIGRGYKTVSGAAKITIWIIYNEIAIWPLTYLLCMSKLALLITIQQGKSPSEFKPSTGFTEKMKKHHPLLVLVLVNLIVGLVLLPGFGESTDEVSQHSYAERTIQAVQSLVRAGTWPAYFTEEEPKQGSHGPAFIMAVSLLRSLSLPAGTRVENLLFSHFLYFLAFQLGIVSLYFLARRWMSDTAALGTALLFNTQPLFFGHAFMNPKDVVFMSFLTASAALGLRMVDRAENPRQATGNPLSDGGRSFLGGFLRGDVWLAGVILGFSSAIRIAAPLVAVMVLVHILFSRKWHVLPRFLAYGLIAFGAMIAFWPYLWPDPPGRLIGSVLFSAQYPDIHVTLFKGIIVDSRNIPLLYLPLLLLVQLTETTWLLVLAGVFSFRKRFHWDFAALVLIWFALPAAAILFFRVNLYDNLRQVFFILPPLFLLAGLGLDWALGLLRRPLARFLLLALILFPGLYANITLYPYQYIYYNSMVGGVTGAYRLYELDYWRLAFKEAQAYLNQTAEVNANIFVGDSKPSAQTFARSDLIFNAFGARKRNWEKYDYIIVSTAENADQQFGEFTTVFTVERDGVPLVVVKTTHPPG